MDRDFRRAIRSVLAAGRSVELVLELFGRMDDASRGMVTDHLLFLTERAARRWSLGAEIFLIKDLPDSTIRRLIDESPCKRARNHWLRHGTDEHTWDGLNRRVECCVIEEAEYRGILSTEQERWTAPVDRWHLGKIAGTLGCKHDWLPMDGGWQCVNCRKRVSNEEVTGQRSFILKRRLHVTM